MYFKAAQHCQGLDVRVLLSGLKYRDITQIKTQNKIELVIFDEKHSDQDIDGFLLAKIENIAKECGTLTLNLDGNKEITVDSEKNEKIYKHTVLGGTFDRLHTAHKILLNEAALLSSKKITVGVTEESMLQGINYQYVSRFIY